MHPADGGSGRPGGWLLLAAGGLLEVGLLLATSATGAVTESRGFRDAFAAEAPGGLWSGFEVLRRGLSSGVAALGGPRDPTQAAAVVLVAGLALAGLAYWVALTSHPGHIRLIVAFGVLFAVTLLAMPGLLSTDLLTYATYGRLAGVYGQNPYLAAPSAVAADPLVQWLDTRPEHASPYGPVWTLLSMAMAWLTAGLDPLGQALSYRVLGSLAVLVGTWLVWRLTRSPAALLLFAWNPLLLVETIASGHNDGLMMVIALAGVLLLVHAPIAARPSSPANPEATDLASTTVSRAARVGDPVGRRAPALASAAGLLILGLAALVKYVPALVLLYAGVALARSRPKLVATSAAAIVALSGLLWLPWLAGSGPGVLLVSISAGGERYVNALLDLPTSWLATHLVDRSGQDIPAAEAAVRATPRAIVRLLFLIYLAWEARRVWRRPDITVALQVATRGYLVALPLVVTQVLAWYFIWPLALAAVLGGRSTLARIAVAYSVTYLPVFYAIHADLVPQPAPLLLAWAILPLLIVLRSGVRMPRPAPRLADSVSQ